MSALNQPHFQDPNKARQYLERIQWPNGPVCPHCGVIGDHYRLEGKATRPGLWKCKDCREQFSVTVGTVFEKSKIKLNVWLQAVFLLCSSKKGISSHQLHRTLGVTYKTAWFMTHRIREAMKSDGGILGGGGKIVEADETYYGAVKGRARNSRAVGGHAGRKHKIFGLVQRDGKTRAFHIANIDGKNIKPILQAQVARESKLFTDSASHWRNLPRGTFKTHSMVNHMAKEYVRGEVHTNSIESFFGLLKRGLVGTYHHVSEAHLQRYCEEFAFRHSHRTSLGVTDDQRTNAALRQISGKRLTYRRTHASEEGLAS